MCFLSVCILTWRIKLFRNKGFSYRFGLSVSAVVVLGAVVLGGCSSGGDDMSSSMPAGPTPVVKRPAMGPAIIDKLKFDQLALDSPVSKISKNGIGYLVFKYTDMQGNIRTCEMPESHSQGEKLPGEWISTFNTYKKAEAVVVKKREVKQTDQGVVDFPFISPKPVRVEPTKQDTPTSEPMMPPPPGPSPSSGTGAPMMPSP